MSKKHFNLLFKIALFVIPFISITFLSSDTYANRLGLDTNNLESYFDTDFGPLNRGYVTFSGSDLVLSVSETTYDFEYLPRLMSSETLNSISCSNYDYYFYIKYNNIPGYNFTDFSTFSDGVGRSLQILDENTFLIHYNGSDYNPYYRDSVLFFVFPDTVNLYDFNGSYSIDTITLGCSEEEVMPQVTPTPTPTPTPAPTPTPTDTPTPTPAPTSDEINPDDYEYNAVEDSIVKYRFMAFVVIVMAGLLLYHVVIKRVILR